ncbi:LamG-like jellyroll fold domain-containing protein [Micromonospora sp. NPDC050417]|uniref:LamG-like jellyroll fold domain-containing protein n=1 Tax=Micromonospora sp. NPDC050417 TaxID=3364280 RepID=UPI0037B182F3
MRVSTRRRPNKVLTGAVAATTALLGAVGLVSVPAVSAAPVDEPAAPVSTVLTTEQALAQAQRTGKAVDVVGATNATDLVTANPDGTLTLTRSAVPVRKRVGDDWKSLDTALTRTAEGAVRPAVTTNTITFSGGGSGPLATMANGGRSLALTAPMPLPAPTLSGDTATYANVLTDVDLQVTADAQGGFRQVFVVRTAAAAADPALKQLALNTTANGVTLAADDAGNLTATDRTGRPVFTAPTPLMWDSATTQTTTTASAGTKGATPSPSPSGKTNAAMASASSARGPGQGAHTAKVAATVRANTIILSPDTELLSAVDTVYPLFIDPSWSSSGSSSKGWATVGKPYPTTNYWMNTPDPQGRMQVGNSGPMWSHTLINFPINTTALAGATINEATFKITETYSYSCKKTQVNVYAPSTTLSQSNATWNYWDGVDLGTAVANQTVAHGYNSTCPQDGVSFNVLSAIKSAVSGNRKTQTFVMTGVNESSDLESWKKFLETSPTLTITYNHTPNTPSGLHTSPATSCTAATPTALGDGPVSLYAPISDPDGGSLGIAFKLWKTSDTNQAPVASSNPASLTYTSGTTAVLNVAQATLKAAAGNAVTRFSWKVQVTDTLATSNWSTTCNFDFDPTRAGAPTVPTPGEDTTTIGTPATITVNPPTSGTIPTSYTYQLNGGAPGRVTATASGVASIAVTPTRRTNTLTVTSLSPAGNFGDTATITFNSRPSGAALDGDLNGDNVADLLLAGSANGLPPGAWLATGKTTGALATNASNFGADGLLGTRNPADFDGAQISTGRFTGNGLQGVLAYYPTGPRAGSGAYLTGSGDGSAMQTAQNGANIRPGDLLDDNNLNPTQLVSAGDASGQHLAWADLLSITGDSDHGYYLNYYASGDGTANYQWPITLATGTPTGGTDWNNWTITSAETPTGTALFLWNKSTGALFLWQRLAFDGIDFTYTQTQLATGWNTSASLVLRAADINRDGNPDLWTVGAGGRVTAYLTGNLTTTPTITAQPTQTLVTSAHTWPLNDGFGNTVATTAADTTGGAPLTVSGRPIWHDGDLHSPDLLMNTSANGTSPDGTRTDVLTSNSTLIDTTKSFSIAVWVKPTAAGGVIVSEDGAHSSRFILWDNADDNTWRFGMANSDNTGWVYDQAVAPAGAQLGVWTHLAAVFNASTHTMSLYVSGTLADTAYHDPAGTWPAGGKFVIGRYLNNSAPSSYYSGQISNVQTWNAALTPTELGATNTQHALAGEWKFDNATGGTTDTSGSYRNLTLVDGATTTGAGKYGQALTVNGTNYATAPNTVNSSIGYTICAWAKHTNSDLRWHAIFSQEATRSSGLYLRTNGAGAWEFVIATSDSQYAAVAAPGTATPDVWTHLCGVWDPGTTQMMLFVNGTLVNRQLFTGGVTTLGPLRIGSYKYLDSNAGFFPGTIDDVRAYDGPITDTDEINDIMNGFSSTAPGVQHALAGEWKFDNATGGTTDTSGSYRNLTLYGTANTGNGGKYGEGLTLDGASYATAPNTLNSTIGYTICAWAKLDNSDPRWHAIFSQEATRSSGLYLRTNGAGAWEFVIATSDSAYAAVAAPGTAAANTWTHLCGVWDPKNTKMTLFLNGTQAATGTLAGGVAATGPIRIGSYKYLDNNAGFFPGTIDDVRAYVGPITDTNQIRTIMNGG